MREELTSEYQNKETKKQRNGFTLIELVVVLAIVAISFTAIYMLYANTIKQDVESKYEVASANLAQEGIEIIKNIRGNNLLNGDSLNDGLPNDGSECYPYFDGETPKCDISRFAGLGKGSDDFYENCDSFSCNGDAIFRRTCNVRLGSGSMEVECTVSWDSFVKSSLERQTSVKVYLTDWGEF